MGLFDFFKGAGDEPTAPPAPKAEKPDAGAMMTATLVKVLDKYGLECDDPKVTFNGGVVGISGSTPDQATKEKIILALGNIKGVSQVDDNIEVENPEPEAQFYQVQSGDSLSKIAKQFYGDPMKYPDIFEANKPMLSDPNKIYPGQVLRIPPQG